MTVREYIGSRYVPLFAGAWDNSNEYEPLTVVTYQGGSYTSKKPVPAGVAISNTEYWESTGNYNAQIESYRSEVYYYADKIQKNADDIADIQQDVEDLQGDMNDAQGAIEALQDDVERLDARRMFFADAVKLPFGSLPNPSYSSVYWLNQGCCTFRREGVDYLFAAVELHDTDTLYFYRVNLDSGTYQRITPPTGAFKHCNDITYNPNTGYLVFADQSLNEPGSVYDFVEYDDINNIVIARHTLTEDRLCTIAYDEAENCYWSVKDSNPYTVGFMVKLDASFNVVQRVQFTPTNPITVQSCDCDDEYIYCAVWRDNNIASALSSGNSIAIFDKAGNYVTQCFEGTPTEIESIAKYQGGFICGFNCNGGAATNTNSLIFAHLFLDKVPFDTSPFNFAVNKWASPWEMALNVYVNGSYTGFFSDGSQERPFKRFQDFMLYDFKCEYLNVIASGVFTQDYMLFSGVHRLVIHGTGGAVPEFNGVIKFRNCPNVTIHSMEISAYAGGNETDYLIGLFSSMLNFSDTTVIDATGMERAFFLTRNSTLIYRNVTLTPGSETKFIEAATSQIYGASLTADDIDCTYNVVLNNEFIG